MLFDILVALAITVLAVVLGITVHPVLLFIIVLAIVYLVVRHRGRSRVLVSWAYSISRENIAAQCANSRGWQQPAQPVRQP